MSVETDVQALTTAVTALMNAVNVKKEALDTAVAEAYDAVPQLFSTVDQLLTSEASARGVGSVWMAAGFSYREAENDAEDYNVITAGGVKLYILKGRDGLYHTDAWGIVVGQDETTKFYDALAKAANGTLFVNYQSETAYITDRLIPAANTTLILEAGVEIAAISGGSRVLQIGAKNIHVVAYGAKTTMDGSQSSHNVVVSHPAEDCSIRGLRAVGAGGTGDDCFYIGGDPANNNLAKNISLIDCKGEGLGDGTRNCLSIVAVDGCLIEGGEYWGADGSPGAGIDLEANLFMADGSSSLKRVIIRNVSVHDNTIGIACVFFDDVLIEHCKIFDNDKDGIGSASGGAQFEDDVYRVGDRFGVISLDEATGWITVEDTNKITDDLNVGIGTVVGKRTSGDGVWPVEFSVNYYVINEISDDQFSFKVGLYFDHATLTGLTGTGTGIKDKDPTVSELEWFVYRQGANSNLTIRDCDLFGNGSATELKLAQGMNYVVERNNVLATTAGISISYSQNVRVEKNKIRGEGGAATSRGLHIGSCAETFTYKNHIEGFGLTGLNIDGLSKGTYIEDTIINCGMIENRAVRFQQGSGAVISPIIWNDKNHPCVSGLICEATVTNSVVQNARCKGAGADNASSITVLGEGMAVQNNIQNDGTFR